MVTWASALITDWLPHSFFFKQFLSLSYRRREEEIRHRRSKAGGASSYKDPGSFSRAPDQENHEHEGGQQETRAGTLQG